jgi:hypothetical protein
MPLQKKRLPERSSGAEKIKLPLRLDAERAAATAGALNVRVVKLEARAFDAFDVIDLYAFKIHRAHLVNGNLQAVKVQYFIGVVGLVLECHVILKTRAAAADYRDTESRGHRALHVHYFFHFCTRYWRQTNHKFPASVRECHREFTYSHKYSKSSSELHNRNFLAGNVGEA